jgi:hypothetical protein
VVPRVGRRLQNHELLRAKVPGDAFDRLHHERQVRIARLAQGGGHADVNDVNLPQRLEGRGRAQAARADNLGQLGRRHIGDVALSLVDLRDLAGVGIDRRDVKSGPCELNGKRQADVAEADHPDSRLLRLNAIEKTCSRHRL